MKTPLNSFTPPHPKKTLPDHILFCISLPFNGACSLFERDLPVAANASLNPDHLPLSDLVERFFVSLFPSGTFRTLWTSPTVILLSSWANRSFSPPILFPLGIGAHLYVTCDSLYPLFWRSFDRRVWWMVPRPAHPRDPTSFLPRSEEMNSLEPPPPSPIAIVSHVFALRTTSDWISLFSYLC